MKLVSSSLLANDITLQRRVKRATAGGGALSLSFKRPELDSFTDRPHY